MSKFKNAFLVSIVGVLLISGITATSETAFTDLIPLIELFLRLVVEAIASASDAPNTLDGPATGKKDGEGVEEKPDDGSSNQ